MVALNESFAPGKPALGSKNRVGNFFGGVAVRAGENRPATRNRIGEKRPTLTIIASGRPVWPSRDPIEEQGGLNLYGMVANDAVNALDYLGLTTFAYDPVLVSGRNKTPDPVYGWTGGEVSAPMWASVSIYATDEGITAYSFAGIGGFWSFATVSASVECDEFGHISFTQSESYMPAGSDGIRHSGAGIFGAIVGGGSSTLITLAAFEEKTFGLNIPDDTINIEAFSGAVAASTFKPVTIPNPGPVLVSFFEQVLGSLFNGGTEESVSARGLYIFKCKCEEIP